MNVSSNNIPSMKNVYDSTYWNKIKHDEQELSNDLYKKSRKPYETGIVSKNATSDTFKRNFYSEINKIYYYYIYLLRINFFLFKLWN